MKNETRLAKLAKLLGLEDLHEQTVKKKATTNKYEPIPEDKIQGFRAAQGLIYFLQAPELFQPKVCKHCGEGFLVSRMHVAFCSWTCIRKDLELQGIDWRKADDEEAIMSLVKTAYDGNEPIWIRNLDRIQAVLDEVVKQHQPS